MGASEAIRSGLLAVTTVPRLAIAARSAGLGGRDVVRVLWISEGAWRIAAARGAGVPGRRNALRHFLWQTLLTAHFGRGVAASIADAQEEGTANLRDSRVDQHNNLVGQAYGEANAAALTRTSRSDALGVLVPVALAKWESDELIWIRPRTSR